MRRGRVALDWELSVSLASSFGTENLETDEWQNAIVIPS